MRINILTHYQTSLLSRVFAKHGIFTSFDILENKLSIKQLVSKKEIPFLDIEDFLVEEGYFWNTLTIHLHDGDSHQLGGINKSKASKLKATFQQKKHSYVKELARKISPTINTAFNKSNTFLRKNQYIRHAKPSLWLNTYLKPLSSFLKEPDITDQLPEETLSQFNQLALEKGKLKPEPSFTERKKEFERLAREDLNTKQAISVRIQRGDLSRIKQLAEKDGVPYQTLISSIVHRYAEGTLKRND